MLTLKQRLSTWSILAHGTRLPLNASRIHDRPGVEDGLDPGEVGHLVLRHVGGHRVDDVHVLGGVGAVERDGHVGVHPEGLGQQQHLVPIFIGGLMKQSKIGWFNFRKTSFTFAPPVAYISYFVTVNYIYKLSSSNF